MEIRTCPHCSVRVVPSADGGCPACRQPIDEGMVSASPEDTSSRKPPVVSPPAGERETPSESPYSGLVKKLRAEPSAASEEYANREPVLRVTRSKEHVELRRPFWFLVNFYRALSTWSEIRVEVDGKIVGELKEEEECRVTVAPGEHRIRVTSAAASSRTVEFRIQNGQRVWYACSGRTTGLMIRRID